MTIKASNFPTVRPTLDLNFAATKRLDPRVTFSRASSGTYVDANGVLQSAATNVPRFDHNPTTGESLGLLVEEARTNTYSYSNDFDNANWSAVVGSKNVTPNVIVSPDGTVNADMFTVTEASWFKNSTAVGGTSPLAFSIFAKAGTITNFITRSFASTGDFYGLFNLSTGTAGSSGTGAGYAYMVPFPNNWYLCVSVRTDNASKQSTQFIPSWTSGSGTIYFYGAQQEVGSFPTSYIPTPATFTGRASTATFYDANGIIQTAASGVARSNAYLPDSSGVFRPAGLLLEAAGTNLVTYSEQFDNAAWSKTGATVTANTTTAPDGTATADTFTLDSSTGSHTLTSPATSVAAGVNIVSYFIKSNGGDYVQLNWGTGSNPNNAYVNFRLSTLEIGTQYYCTGYIQKLPNGWFRVSMRVEIDTPGAQTAIALVTGLTSTRNESFTGDGTSGIYIWGAQLEASPYPTSYIPTTGSTVTRAADTSTSATVTRSADVAQITGANFSGFYRADEGTTFCGFRATASTSGFYENVFSYAIGIASGQQALYRNNSNTSIGYGALGPGVPVITVSNWLNTSHKAAGAYKTNDIALGLNGSLSTSTSATTFASSTILRIGEGFNQLPVNKYNGTISRLTYWPTRLSDATLQTITR